MDPQLYAALIALGIIVIGAVGTIVKALTNRVIRDLAANTKITTEAKEASNGRLKDALDRLAAERDRSLALRQLLRERDDRLAYLHARLPGVDDVLQGYEERRQRRHSDTEERDALRRILEEPTG